MNKLIIATVLIFAFGNMYAQGFQFRGFEWGTTKEKIKKNERAPFVLEKDNLLQYRSTLGDYDADLEYYFSIDGELMGARYTVRKRYKDLQDHFKEFDFFTELLTEKYGKPVAIQIVKEEVNVNNVGSLIASLKSGDFAQEIKWDLPDTAIQLTLTGEGKDVIMVINYQSKKYGKMNHQLKREMVLKDL
ncbi:MAG TPA: hypothetical protein ENJ95_05025 [Bacteroidetes bacterium]|nr:hypothetical protein [Bacteroidota bacterium]